MVRMLTYEAIELFGRAFTAGPSWPVLPCQSRPVRPAGRADGRIGERRRRTPPAARAEAPPSAESGRPRSAHGGGSPSDFPTPTPAAPDPPPTPPPPPPAAS